MRLTNVTMIVFIIIIIIIIIIMGELRNKILFLDALASLEEALLTH